MRPSSPATRAGPLVLEDGTVGGLVFAESKTDPAVGYAMSPSVVANRIAPAIGSRGAVDVGALPPLSPCARARTAAASMAG